MWNDPLFAILNSYSEFYSMDDFMTKILIPVEDSKFAEAQIAFIRKHVLPADTQFSLLSLIEANAVQDFGGALPYTYLAEIAKDEERYSNQLLEETESQLRKHFPDAFIEKISERGPAADAIINIAKKGNFDWIIVGSHGRSGFDKFLLGSVSQKVVSHAPCSVTVVRLPKENEHIQTNEKVTASSI